MFGAAICQKHAQNMESVESAPEFGSQDKFPQSPFIDAAEKEVIPRGKLLQTVAARNDRRVCHGKRLAAIRAESGFSEQERRTALRAEKSRGSAGLMRDERLPAGSAAAFVQGKQTD